MRERRRPLRERRFPLRERLFLCERLDFLARIPLRLRLDLRLFEERRRLPFLEPERRLFLRALLVVPAVVVEAAGVVAAAFEDDLENLLFSLLIKPHALIVDPRRRERRRPFLDPLRRFLEPRRRFLRALISTSPPAFAFLDLRLRERLRLFFLPESSSSSSSPLCFLECLRLRPLRDLREPFLEPFLCFLEPRRFFDPRRFLPLAFIPRRRPFLDLRPCRRFLEPRLFFECFLLLRASILEAGFSSSPHPKPRRERERFLERERDLERERLLDFERFLDLERERERMRDLERDFLRFPPFLDFERLRPLREPDLRLRLALATVPAIGPVLWAPAPNGIGTPRLGTMPQPNPLPAVRPRKEARCGNVCIFEP